jgi:uncharacterized protein (TIGR00251 family)
MASSVIRLRVTPRSGRDEVIGWEGDELRVRVRAAPVEGQANEALCRLIAKQAGVPYRSVEVVSGATSRTKTLRIDGLSQDEVRAKLGAHNLL